MFTDYVKMDISSARDKHELIRMLAMLRLRSDLEASSRGITEHSVLGFTEDDIAILPESLVIHIVSDYYVMKKNGVKDNDIFKRLDVQRTLQGHEAAAINTNETLSDYIKHRLHIEFPQLSALEDKVIDMETIYAVYWFSKDSRTTADWKKADAFANETIAEIHQRHQNIDNNDESARSSDHISKSTAAKKSKTWWVASVFVALTAAAAYWIFVIQGIKSF